MESVKEGRILSQLTYSVIKSRNVNSWKKVFNGPGLNSCPLMADTQEEMNKANIHILIVEDDVTLGEAMAKAIAKKGYGVKWVSRPDDAIKAVEAGPAPSALIVDCMLPKMNGVDLSQKLVEKMETAPLLILTSGIFRDRTFTTEAIAKTGAKEFLTKPFEVEQVLLLLENNFSSGDTEESHSPLNQLLMLSENDPKRQIEVISDLDSVHSFELPTIYSLLMDANITGHLNIIDADGNVSGVGFKNGCICQVDVKNSSSFFVSLLIEKGFVLPSEVEQALAMPSKKKIGERLVDGNVMSPHAIDIVLREQMAILLSKTIRDSSAKIRFMLSETINSDIQITKNMLLPHIHDWVTSKFTANWLKSHYLQWFDNPIRKGVNSAEAVKLSRTPHFVAMPGFIKQIEGGVTLSQLLERHEFDETDVYRAIHLLATARVIGFAKATTRVDLGKRKERLEKIYADLKNRNYYEILGVGAKATEAEIERAFRELHKISAPETLPEDAADDLKRIANGVYQQAEQAYSQLRDKEKRKEYDRKLEANRAETMLRAEALFSEGKSYIKKNMISKAAEAFHESAKLTPPNAELTLHILWTKIKSIEADNRVTPENLSKIATELGRIPPEERHNSTYYFVQGLYQMLAGDFSDAQKNFEHVLSQDKNFIEARRELNRIKVEADKKPNDLLSADVRQVFGMLFKRKKTG